MEQALNDVGLSLLIAIILPFLFGLVLTIIKGGRYD
jgi:hypothetical protein